MRIESFNPDVRAQLTGSTKPLKTNGPKTESPPKSEARSLDTVDFSSRSRKASWLGEKGGGARGGRGGTPIFDAGDDRVHGQKNGDHKSRSVDRGGSIDRGHSIDRGYGHKYGHNKVRLEETIQVGEAELNLKFKGPVSERSATNMVRKLHHQVDKFIEKNGVDETTSDAAHELIGELAGDVFGAVYAEHGDRAAMKDAFQSAFASFAEALNALFNPVDETSGEQTGEVSLTERELEGEVNTGSTSGEGSVGGSIGGGVDLLGTGEIVTSGTTGSTGQLSNTGGLGTGSLLDVSA